MLMEKNYKTKNTEEKRMVIIMKTVKKSMFYIDNYALTTTLLPRKLFRQTFWFPR